MAILGITNKYASWPAKVDHEAYSCNFPHDVRMNVYGLKKDIFGSFAYEFELS